MNFKRIPVVLTAITLAGQLSLPAAAISTAIPSTYAGDVSITEVFPDRAFQAWLLDKSNLGGIGVDGILTEEERLSVTELNLSNLGLTTLNGLELFPNLEELDCSYNNLTQLDVSNNLNLKHLSCRFNRINQLDLTGLSNLISLNCEMNQMSSLDMTGCTALLIVYCRNNQLTKLDLTDNTKLKFIETFDNRLTSIDVRHLQDLEFLHIDYNRLIELDLRGNTKLQGGGFVALNNFIERIYLPIQPDLTVYLEDYDEQDPIRGHDRVAWFLDPNFEEPAPEELSAQGQILYSQRIPNSYTIYFSSNGGTGSLAQISTRWDSQVELPENTFQRYGYKFSHWNTRANGDGSSYSAAESVSNLAGANTDGDRITLYAQWTPNQYTIRLDPNGGQGEAVTQSADYGKAVTLPKNTFVKENMEFAGWAKTPYGKVVYLDQDQVQNLTGEENGVVTLYAVWRKPLSEIQRPYLETLNNAFQTYDEKNYTSEDWSSLSDIYQGAVNQIQQMDSVFDLERTVTNATKAMAAVLTQSDRVAEVSNAWKNANQAALDGLSSKALTETDASQAKALAQAALDSLAQEQLEQLSTLSNQADRQQVAKAAAQQLQTTADALADMQAAAAWLEGLDGLTLRELAQVQETHLDEYQCAISSYEALDESLKGYISESVPQRLNQCYELSQQKGLEVQALQEKYNALDQSLYSAKGQAALESALNQGLAAIRSAASVDAVHQAGADAWKQISQVPTADQETTTPPEGGGAGGGSGSGGIGGGGGAGGSTGGSGTGGAPGEVVPEAPEESDTVTITDEKTGATAVVTTDADGKMTAEVTLPEGVAHATIRIPCEGHAGTVAVQLLADGSRKVLPRSVYRDGALVIPLDSSATIEIVDGSKDFSDVTAADWFTDSVQFAVSHGLFFGVGNDRFAPYDTMTRSMLVTVLHRLEGTPASTASGNFQDVPQDSWYSAAVDWAAEQGITSGTAPGRFDPDAPITREALAVMLYRYAGSPAVEADGTALEAFHDRDKVSAWASRAIQWACANGIITGDAQGQLRPQDNSTRAEVAAMLARFAALTVE